MYKLDLEKAEKPEIELSTFIGSWRKQGNSRKTSTSISLTTLKPLTVCITTNCGKFFKRWNTRPPYCLLINLYAGQEATESDMKQWTGSKLRKESVKAVYCHLVYLTYMQSMSCEMPVWMKHKWNQDCQEKY